ncbi:MAG TPA: NADP-dependent oxidoreductase [Solirubrobacteraceae bacterium]|jgi:NADPH:quinone reductase-like Zn-dependent oxidoreductase|nr:NADP-dependent oxidoreductase [Solirubrobacteraceae bacterium]
MSRAVRFDEYGGVDVLNVVDVDPPTPGPGQLLVRVKAAGINPGEAKIREGEMHERFPSTFPSGEGSDLAGVVEQAGDGVTDFSLGDEVLGFTHNRASHAEHVVVEADNVTRKPPNVSWEAAGSLYVVGATAYAAVRAVGLTPGETVVVAGAAGGVGSVAVQLAKRNGARVIGLASDPNHRWLRDHGVMPVSYGEGVAERIREAAGGAVDAFIDTVGGGYVEFALELGVAPERVETIIDFAAARKHGTKMAGSMDASNAVVLTELADLIDRGELEIPIAGVYPLDQVRDAFREVEGGHTHGKIVLVP